MNKSFKYRLPNGREVLFRPIKPEDAPLLLEAFTHLSADSRMKRFFTPRNSLTESQVKYLTNVDQHNHVAWVAVNMEETEGYGVGRYIRLGDDPKVAEYAITVVDEFHNLGLGTALFTLVYLLARHSDLKHLSGYLIQGNAHFIERLKALNATIAQHEGVYQAKIPLEVNLNELPKNPYSKRFVMRFMQMQLLMNLPTQT